MNYGNINFLEHSGPLQACNGTALPLPLHNTYPHRTHQYLTQKLDLSGSKTSTLDFCVQATTHIANSRILIKFSQEYVNMGHTVAQLV